jgi:hypothetical protein
VKATIFEGIIIMSMCGADATHPATPALISLAGKLLSNQPRFFGRYFKGPHNPSPIQYQSGEENSVLHAAGIRVLCIGRQTNRVGGTNQDGVADAVNNMSAVVSAFGADYLASLGFEPLMFLDTEPENPLSVSYFLGWAGALRKQGPIAPGIRLQFKPAIYLNQGDAKTWRALTSAMSQGAVCAGAWVANYGSRTGAEGPPQWSDAQTVPKPPLKSPCPILAWQYAGDYEDVLDFSIVADNAAEDTLGQLILPPEAAPAVA